MYIIYLICRNLLSQAGLNQYTLASFAFFREVSCGKILLTMGSPEKNVNTLLNLWLEVADINLYKSKIKLGVKMSCFTLSKKGKQKPR